MTKNSYWQERFEQIEQAANNKAVRHNSKLEKKYRQAAAEIDAQINKWYNRIAKNNQMSISEARRLLTANELKEFKWSVEQYIDYGRQNALDQQWVKELENASAKFHINRLEAMKLEVRHQIEMAMANGQQDMFDVLGDVYKDSFYRSAFELQKGVGIGFDVAKLDDTTVSRVLSKPWAADGTNFSEKLWTNKKKLINTLDTELSRMVLLGDTPDRAVKTIKEAMNSSLFQAKRLVFTEQAYFATEAQKKAFNSLDVERFEVVSSADRKVCPVCAAKDKQNFPMIEFHIGITAPPFHPLCRCVTAPFFDDEFTSQTRIVKDDAGEKYEIPATMNYGEWKKAFVDGGSKKEYRVINALPFSKVKQQKALKDIVAEMPPKMQEALNDTKVVLDSAHGNCYYEDSDTMHLGRNYSPEEVWHEAGHVVEYKLIDADELNAIKRSYVNGLGKDDILEAVGVDANGNKKDIFVLNSDNFIDYYQSRIYANSKAECLDSDGRIDISKMHEVVSYASEVYYSNKTVLRETQVELFELLERVLK